MRRWLLRLLVVLALWGADLLLHRWLQAFGVTVPILWSFGMAAAFLYGHEALSRLTLPLGLASELGSDLPFGVAFLTTLVLAHGLALLLRRPRPSLPAAVRFGIAALLLATVTLALDGLLARLNILGPWPPPRLLLEFLGRHIVIPSLLGAVLAVAVARLLQFPRPQAAARALFGADAA